jgi:hypothetical protein
VEPSLVVAHAHGEPATVEHVCAAAMSATGVDSAAVTVALTATPCETIYARDRVASQLEELTLTLGEGPGVDAVTGGPTLVADLAAPDCLARWPVFAPAVGAASARCSRRRRQGLTRSWWRWRAALRVRRRGAGAVGRDLVRCPAGLVRRGETDVSTLGILPRLPPVGVRCKRRC